MNYGKYRANEHLDIDYRKLPKSFFDVQVATKYTYTDVEFELMGTPVDEDMGMNGEDSKIMTVKDKLVWVKLTPEKIFDIYNQGGSIKMRNKDEAMRLYNIYKKFYSDWINQNNQTLNVDNNLPKTQLIMLERFMEEIYEYNGVSIVKNSIQRTSAFGINVNRLHSNGEYGGTTLDPVIVGGNTGLTDPGDKPRGQYDTANQPNRPVINLDKHKPKRRINLHEIK